MGMIKKVDKLGRVAIPKNYLKQLNVETNNEVKVDVLDNKIVVEKLEKEVKTMKTKFEIELQLNRMQVLYEELEDEKLKGSIEALEWVLNPNENEADYMNDY